METLTERQLQVVVLAADGMTNIEIARRLSIEASSVKTHIETACRKLGARNRTHMVHLAHLNRYLGGTTDVRT